MLESGPRARWSTRVPGALPAARPIRAGWAPIIPLALRWPLAGARIAALRIAGGLTKESVSAETGIEENRFSEIEAGIVRAKSSELYDAVCLDASISDILADL